MNNLRNNSKNAQVVQVKFLFSLLCGASKGFMKASKAFIKPFETSQRSVKVKIGFGKGV